MPVLLVLVPFAALVIYFATRQAPAAAAILPGAGSAWTGGNDAPELAALVPGVAAADNLGAFDWLRAAVVEPVEVVLRRVFQLPAAGAPYADQISAAERAYGIPETLLARVLYQESRFRPDVITGATRSAAGALGIAQFMPATAREWGVDPLNPASAIDGAGRYLRYLFDQLGDWSRALAAYNWGMGNVKRRGLEAAPAETRDYVAAILGDVEV